MISHSCGMRFRKFSVTETQANVLNGRQQETHDQFAEIRHRKLAHHKKEETCIVSEKNLYFYWVGPF